MALSATEIGFEMGQAFAVGPGRPPILGPAVVRVLPGHIMALRFLTSIVRFIDWAMSIGNVEVWATGSPKMQGGQRIVRKKWRRHPKP